MIEISGTNVEDPNGDLDEVCGRNCDVHLERMDDTAWCLIVQDDSRKVIVNLGYVRGRGKMKGGRYGFVFADDPQDVSGMYGEGK